MSDVWLEPGTHAVRFYDSAPAAHASIAEFFTSDLRDTGPLVMVSRRETFEGVAALLASGRYGPPMTADRIRHAEAGEAVHAIMDGDVVDPARAFACFSQLLAEVRRDNGSGTIRMYGEGVDVLCQRGNFDGALALEDVAGRLFAFEPRLVILCGYARGQFVDGGAGAAHFHAVHGLHSHAAPMEGGYEPGADGEPPPSRTAGAPPRDNVYIVDDDPSIRRSLKRLLSLSFGTVRVFESGEAYFADLDGLAPGVLVADIQLGGMSGLDILAHMKATRPTWPAIAMSGSDDAAAEREALRLGARVFLKKPFESQALIDAIAAALSSTA